MCYLSIENLSVWYDKFHAVKDVLFSVKKGTLFTLLGPSGSGKSTVLLSVAGFVMPRYGEISLNGENITYLAPNKREIGMVFQSYALFPHRNVFDNIAYPLRVRKVSKDMVRKRVLETVRLVQMNGLEHRMPHELSGGQQQRVALARALVFNPRLLLLDEPLGALDKKLREQMQYEIRRLQKESASTVIYVTHDQSEAMAISDQIAVLRNGQIEQIGPPMEIYEDPANPFVADFVGGANFLPIEVHGFNESTCILKWGDYALAGVPRPRWLYDQQIDASLMVRPEHLRVEIQQRELPNVIPCSIQEIYYLGEIEFLKCTLTDGTPVNVRQPFTGEGNLRRGDSRLLVVDTKKARLFPAQRESSE